MTTIIFILISHLQIFKALTKTSMLVLQIIHTQLKY